MPRARKTEGEPQAQVPPVPDTAETRQAAIDTARANADKARFDALKAEADAEKAAADARSAAAKASTDERDAAQAESALGQKQRDAASRQKIAEAEKAASTAQAERIATYLPDLSKVKRGKLDLEKAELPLFAGALENRALTEAAIEVATSVKTVEELTEDSRILVTSDAELAASHAAYLEVMGGLDQIDTAATGLLAELAAPGEAVPEHEEAEPKVRAEFAPVAAIAQAVATVLPGALSLFSAHRAVATSETTVEDLEAAAAVAGQLVGWKPTIVHDGFRLLVDGPLRRKLEQLNTHRQNLVSRQLAFGDEKARVTEDLALAKAELEAAKADLKESPKDQAAKQQVRTSTGDVADAERKLAHAELRLGLVVSAIEAIDAFSNSLTEVPEGAVRSPLTLATMREHLQAAPEWKQDTKPSHFTHILLVKGNGGSTTQVIDDRALWMADRFASVGTARITYMLIESTSSAVLAAGDASGAAKASGKLSRKLSLELKRVTFAD
jgi:hypothetical protein